jgi:hypothetical protein
MTNTPPNAITSPRTSIDSTWDLTGGLQDVELVYAIGEKLANSRCMAGMETGLRVQSHPG